MARHWSVFCPGVTSRQAGTLDRMAEANGKGDGMALLCELTGRSRSWVGRQDYLSLRRYIDEAFRLYGRSGAAE